MSYARKNENSDVYMTSYVGRNRKGTRRQKVWVCHNCILNPLLPYEGTFTAPGEGYFPSTVTYSRRRAHEHLKKHFLAGHKVPETAFHRLEIEMGLVKPD